MVEAPVEERGTCPNIGRSGGRRQGSAEEQGGGTGGQEEERESEDGVSTLLPRELLAGGATRRESGVRHVW